jgi:hypothetical protein
MPTEPYAVVRTPVAIPAPQRRCIERLSFRAAIFWIGALSLAGWTVAIALAAALV